MTLIFDYDGTIHNTKRLYGCAFRKAYQMLVNEGYAEEHFYSDDDVSKYLGVNAPDMWNDFMPQLPEEVWQRASMMIGSELIEGVLGGNAVLYDGIAEALDELKSSGFRMIILSNCRHSYMEAHRKAVGLDRWFTDYFCAEDYGFIPKEDIFPILKEKYPDDDYIMIGDRSSDFKVGIKNGLPVIGCEYGFGTPQELEVCTLTVSTPNELVKSLSSDSKVFATLTLRS